jgi:capsular polysaccharide biosynthesis protein
MEHKKYQQIVEETTPKPNKLLNMFIAFFMGGIIGVIGTFLYNWLLNYYNSESSISFMLLIMIMLIKLKK